MSPVFDASVGLTGDIDVMPWLLPSHPAPLLPLKLWKPAAFSGLALCIGAAAPDLEFVLQIQQDHVISHTLIGQLVFTLPVVLVLHALLTSLLLPWLVPLLPFGAPWHLEDLLRLRPATSAADWARVGVSGILGGLSHMVLDGFTHGTHSGWAVPYFPALATPVPLPAGPVPFHDVLHVTLTIVLGAWALRMLRDMGQRRLIARWYPGAESASREATPFQRRGAIGYFLTCALLGIAVGTARSHTQREWIELGANGALALTFYGLVIAATLDRVRLSLATMRKAPEPSEG
jgi:hypothetical protein